MNTAIREILMDSTVKPISLAPCRAAPLASPLFQVPRDVFNHDDRIVHHESRGHRQRHQRKVVETVARQVHHAEGADERHRNGHRRE